MSDALTTTSHAVLAQLAVRPWSAYELARQRVRYFRYVWPRAESAIYREVKRLAAMGLAEGHREYQGRRARTVYTITGAGRDALREWLATPVSPLAMEFEALLRVFIAPLGTKEQLESTLQQVREDAADMLRFAGAARQEYMAGINPTQEQVYVRALAFDFFVHLLGTVDEWAARSLDEIMPWADLTPDGKNTRGLEILRALPLPKPDAPVTEPVVPPRA